MHTNVWTPIGHPRDRWRFVLKKKNLAGVDRAHKSSRGGEDRGEIFFEKKNGGDPTVGYRILKVVL